MLNRVCKAFTLFCGSVYRPCFPSSFRYSFFNAIVRIFNHTTDENIEKQVDDDIIRLKERERKETKNMIQEKLY